MCDILVSNIIIDSNIFFNGNTLNEGASIDLDNLNDIDITRNLFENDYPVALAGSQSSESNILGSSTSTYNIRISGNIWKNVLATSIYFGGGISNSILSHNSFIDGASNGVRIGNAFPTINKNIRIKKNNFIRNKNSGLVIDPNSYEGILNATKNWWNLSSGPILVNIPTTLNTMTTDVIITSSDSSMPCVVPDKIINANFPNTLVEYLPFLKIPFR